MRLRLLEEERQRLTKKFVEENDFIGELSLQELGTLTGNNVFKKLRSSLLSLLQSIEEMNKFNSTLIDRSLNYIKTSSSFITTLTKEETTQDTGILLSKET